MKTLVYKQYSRSFCGEVDYAVNVTLFVGNECDILKIKESFKPTPSVDVVMYDCMFDVDVMRSIEKMGGCFDDKPDAPRNVELPNDIRMYEVYLDDGHLGDYLYRLAKDRGDDVSDMEDRIADHQMPVYLDFDDIDDKINDFLVPVPK